MWVVVQAQNRQRSRDVSVRVMQDPGMRERAKRVDGVIAPSVESFGVSPGAANILARKLHQPGANSWLRLNEALEAVLQR